MPVHSSKARYLKSELKVSMSLTERHHPPLALMPFLRDGGENQCPDSIYVLELDMPYFHLKVLLVII